jgi:hypothetical protein
MASFNFPTSPANGDTYTLNGITYAYNSVKTRWEVQPDVWDSSPTDSHLADDSIHYPQSAISITESQISDFGSYEPADATILKSAAIGVTVQAYDADTAKLDVAQAWTASQDFVSTNALIRMNPSTLTEDVTIPSYYNAFSAGPLTIGLGSTVTVNDNANWSII